MARKSETCVEASTSLGLGWSLDREGGQNITHEYIEKVEFFFNSYQKPKTRKYVISVAASSSNVESSLFNSSVAGLDRIFTKEYMEKNL